MTAFLTSQLHSFYVLWRGLSKPECLPLVFYLYRPTSTSRPSINLKSRWCF
jgi:hypothetical protein